MLGTAPTECPSPGRQARPGRLPGEAFSVLGPPPVVHSSPQACPASPPSPRPLPLPHGPAACRPQTGAVQARASPCPTAVLRPNVKTLLLPHPPKVLCSLLGGRQQHGRLSSQSWSQPRPLTPRRAPPCPPLPSTQAAAGDRTPTAEAGSPAPVTPGPEPQPHAALSRQPERKEGVSVPFPQLRALEPGRGWGLALRGLGPARRAPAHAGRAMAWSLPHHSRGVAAGQQNWEAQLRPPPPARATSSSVCGGGSAPPCTQVGHGMGRRQPSPTPVPGPTCRPPSTPTPTPRPGVDSLPQDTGRHLLFQVLLSAPSPGPWVEGRVR